MSLPLLECKYVTEEFVREGKSGSYGSKLPSSVPMLRFLYELCWVLVYTLTHKPSLPISPIYAYVFELLKVRRNGFIRFVASCRFRAVR